MRLTSTLTLLTPLICATVVAVAALSLPAVAGAPELRTKIIASGLSAPTYATFAPGDPSRLYVIQQNGIIRVIKNDVLQPTPFLNIDALIPNETFNGLIGIAFHPDFQSNGYFYLHHPRGGGSSDRLTLARYTATSADLADPGSREEILVLPYPALPGHHIGGWVGFGADGYLYVTTGDGNTTGGETAGGARSQSLSSPWGKTLRIDVDGDDFPADPDKDYAIPPDNPFVGQGGDEAVWLFGLRQPYRACFDRQTNDFWIADVGRSAREEIDFVPAGMSGLNFGWNCAEGTICSSNANCNCTTTPLVAPIFEYNTGAMGCTISGGAIYRGNKILGLDGTYFYGDWCSDRIWSLRYEGGVVLDAQERTAELDPPGGVSFNSILSVCEGYDGELYITDSSRVYRIEGQPWLNQGFPLAGFSGNPQLIGTGWLEGGDPLSIELTNARKNSVAWMTFGLSAVNAPFYGGTFVPNINPPGFASPFITDGDGAMTINAVWPLGVPAGLSFYIQYWIEDVAGVFGFAASNAISATTL
jgi:glucose/arabinose dehydrogenase